MVSDAGHKSFLPNLRSELKHDVNEKDRSERDILFVVPPKLRFSSSQRTGFARSRRNLT